MGIKNFVAIDIETTGVSPAIDEIIEISICRFEEGELVESWETLVCAKHPVPREITRLTGISSQDLQRAPCWEEIADLVRDKIGELPVVGHNVEFDLGFLRARGIYAGHFFDTCQLARLLYPGLSSYSLAAVASFLGLKPGERHRARWDAELAGQLFLLMQAEVEQRPLPWLTMVAKWANPAWSLGKLIRETAEAALKAGFAQLPPTMEWLTAGQRLQYADSAVTDSGLTIAEIFATGGPLARVFNQWESRAQQIELAEAIFTALANERHLVAEAGTGTGKSLAYLLPAAKIAIREGARVVISTNTLALQEQLLEKDGPVLQQIFPGLKILPLKGRSNYLCWRRWWELVDGSESWDQETWTLAGRLAWWLHITKTGDEAELRLHGPDRSKWDLLKAERDICLGNACPWQKCCWVQTNRLAAQKAQLLVTNHSLLCTDLKLEDKVLPGYDYLIIDEAHNLEEVAQRHLGLRLGEIDFRRWRTGLWRRPFGGQGPLGVLESLPLREIKEELLPVKSLSQEVESREKEFWEFIASGERLPEVVGDNYLLKLKMLVDSLNKLVSQARAWNQEGLIAESLLSELGGRVNQGQELVETLEIWLQQPFSHWVYWIEDGNICAVPVEVGPILQEQLWSRKKSVIFCSATLSIAGKNHYYAESIGLRASDYKEIVLSSPFDYRNQALLLGVAEGPDPGREEDRLAEYQAAMLLQLLSHSEERVLALFTSYKHLNTVADLIAEPMLQMGRKLLLHGRDGSRGRLIQEFKSIDGAVLFGTQSFWEGVDLPGDLLRMVVIMKLPFAVPTYPPVQAKMELCRQAGKNPFTRVSLPRAIIQFKQGFGRLIRTAEDWGLVVILDPRLKNKSYGREFLNSLPEVNVEWAHPREIGLKAKTWLEARKMLQYLT
ncbi:helicase C-terminal domain-containing protein [Carboxydocella sp. JDF658]|uniref:helicase C-terminal domain-containing protein n=1 Tax=Carboxydocella sp. JDF658 TaxID=1926600 RepID=UPI0009AC0D66|nr:helicase C-terminal domain-containing protein [Carboxydocella sp. JDF658]GAW32091.1 hypothetical protein JDF658_18560 [Carboxydocella sp. JDF658]